MPALAALLGGCANTSSQALSSDYYRDAQLCQAQNTVETPARLDKTQYLNCMARLGWKQEAGTDPLLKSLDICAKAQPAAKKSGRARPETGPASAAYQECLQQRGIQGDIAGEPLRKMPRHK